MSRKLYVACSVNPGDSADHVFYVRSSSTPMQQMQLDELVAQQCLLVTHDSWLLCDVIRRASLEYRLNIFDINHYARYTCGRPKSDFSGAKPWETISLLQAAVGDAIDVDKYWRFFWRSDATDEQSNESVACTLLDLLETTYLKAEELRNSESGGFFDVEIPVNDVMLNRQRYGIAVDSRTVEHNKAKVDIEFYTCLADLRDTHDYRGDIFDVGYLFDYLENLGAELPPEFANMPLDKQLDFHAEGYPAIDLLKMLRGLTHTRSALSKISDPTNSRVFPIFETIGTVTGRITVLEPLVQYMKKAYRSVLAADDGYKLAYFDYAGFEPRILGAMSKDKVLTRLFEDSDFYSGFCRHVGLEYRDREVGKILFLQYMYGASDKTMSGYLVRKKNLGDKVAIKIVRKIGKTFHDSEKWKTKRLSQIAGQDTIVVGHGIRRLAISPSTGRSIGDGRIINHLIQGSGAAFMKNLILRIRVEYPDVGVLLPMHDALLLQVPIKSYESLENDLYKVFVNSFNDYFDCDFGEVTIGVF